MWDVGCGTGGYYQLLKNYRHITGIDASAQMIQTARQLQSELKIDNVAFVCNQFEKYVTQQKFDVVKETVSGWYVPWSEEIVTKIAGLLKPHGLVVVQYIGTDTLANMLKYLLFPRLTKIISRKRLYAMFRKVGLEAMFSVELPTKNHLVFFKR
jgi:2-polyprenyl-3-methyl-5-hydroxy-6-metoxy-1,4-benzoquinol methylase